jgi:hypothetical protein
MIPVEIGTLPGDKNKLTFRSLDLNDPTDDPKSTYHIEEILESDVWQQAYEPYPNRDGSQAYEPFMLYKMFQVRGWVRAESLAELFDLIETLNKTFNPINCYLADTSTFNRGYLPLDFNVPTEDTTNYATGLIACRYYVQALNPPVSLETKFDGLNARIDFNLRAVDPRRYLQTTSSGNRTSNGALVLDNSLASVRSYASISIALPAGAPTGTGTVVTSEGSKTVSIDLTQLAASTTYDLDMQGRTFVKSSDSTNKIAAIDAASQFFPLVAKSQTLTFGGCATGTVFTVRWRRALL